MAEQELNEHMENEDDNKGYDRVLMGRLMGFAKPWRHLFVIAFLCLALSTATTVLGPFLIKTAIDRYILVPDRAWAGDVRALSSMVSVSIPADGTPGENRWWLTRQNGSFWMVSLEETPEVLSKKTLTVTGGTVQVEGKARTAVKLSAADVISLRGDDIRAVRLMGLLYLAAVIAGFLFTYLQINTLNRAGQNILLHIRKRLFSHMMRLPATYFDKNPVGRLVTRVVSDTEALNDMYTNALVSLLQDILLLAGVTVMLFLMDVRLAFIVLAVLPPLMVVTVIFRIQIRKVYRNVRLTLARVNAALSENISGMRIIQLFSRQKEKNREFEEINDAWLKAGIAETVVFGMFRPFIDMLSALTVAALLYFGGAGIMDNRIAFGVVFAFISYVGIFFQPINDLAEKYNILQSAMAASERIFQILDTPAESDQGQVVLPEQKIPGDIRFENVWFAYDEENWVLRDVSFHVPAGKTYAIVGATGAGKTTIISLLSRLYPLNRGRIILDGQDVAGVKLDSLRKHIGIVLQDVFLFAGPLRDNLSLGSPLVTDAVMADATATVNADTFIHRLSDGFLHVVRERGATFSTGERQLLSFARVLAADPSVLILDEATSSIDTETEQLIQDALKKLTHNRTTLIIAHRLSTIQHADGILVMHKGKVRESGTHQELLEKKGLYYDLYRVQYGGKEM